MLASIARSPATDGVTLVGSGGLKTVLALLVAKPSADNASTREAAMEVVRAMVTQNGVTRRGHLVRFRSCLRMHLACLPCFLASASPSLGLIPLETCECMGCGGGRGESSTGRGAPPLGIRKSSISLSHHATPPLSRVIFAPTVHCT